MPLPPPICKVDVALKPVIKSLPSPLAYLNKTLLPLLVMMSSLSLPAIVTFAPLFLIVSFSSVPSISIDLTVLLTFTATGIVSPGFTVKEPSGRTVSPTAVSVRRTLYAASFAESSAV